MKIIVVSDSHNNYGNLLKILKANADADKIIHLGDGENDVGNLMTDEPALYRKLIFIGGNCDLGFHQKSAILTEGNFKIFITHGDTLRVKTDKKFIASAAAVKGCNAAFFGHTHVKYLNTVNDILLLNPGSCDMSADGSKPSYAIVTIENDSISAEFKEV